MKEINIITKCRVCEGNLKFIMSLGNQYVSDFVEDQKDTIQVPLELAQCENKECGLLQLQHNAPPESMWNDHYGYKSGINRLIRENLEEIAEEIEDLMKGKLKPDNYVIDIGANDGTLLEYYLTPNKTRRIGFEPSSNVAAEAEAKGLGIIRDFFNKEEFRKITPIEKAKVITAISMFYDLDNPNQFLKDIKECLAEDGIFVIQQNYLKSMLEQNAFDNIVAEHRCYYSLQSLKYLLERNGLELFDVKFNDINGGSIRTYIKHKGCESFKISPRVKESMDADLAAGLNTAKPYEEFADRIAKIKREVMHFLKKETAKGKKIVGCGASTRGNTTLQYFGITPDLISVIGDSNPAKWGKKTPGSLIPIVSLEEVKKINPDYQFVLIWHLFEAIREKEGKGKFILPMPYFRIEENQ